MRNTIFEEDVLLTKVAETPVKTNPVLTGRMPWKIIASRYRKYALLMARVTVISTSPRWLK